MASHSSTLAWENLTDRGTWWATEVTESDAAEHTRTHFFKWPPEVSLKIFKSLFHRLCPCQMSGDTL